MKKNCEATYTDSDTGHERACQTGTPNTADRVVNGLPVCDVCFEDMLALAMQKTGASRRVAMLAFRIVGKKGRGIDSKVGKALIKKASEKSGLSQQEIDRQAREAMRKVAGGE